MPVVRHSGHCTHQSPRSEHSQQNHLHPVESATARSSRDSLEIQHHPRPEEDCSTGVARRKAGSRRTNATLVLLLTRDVFNECVGISLAVYLSPINFADIQEMRTEATDPAFDNLQCDGTCEIHQEILEIEESRGREKFSDSILPCCLVEEDSLTSQNDEEWKAERYHEQMSVRDRVGQPWLADSHITTVESPLHWDYEVSLESIVEGDPDSENKPDV